MERVDVSKLALDALKGMMQLIFSRIEDVIRSRGVLLDLLLADIQLLSLLGLLKIDYFHEFIALHDNP